MKPYYEDEHVQIWHGDCREVINTLADSSVDSVVCDPPYELGFMGKGWDRSGIAYDVAVWSECLRVLKPGGHLLAFGGSRTYHRLACAIEDAGFEIRDQIQWIYGCLSDDTEILINGQWEPYHKAIKDSLALCYNMDHDTFEWQPVQELLVYPYSDTAYRIESDYTDQIVSRNHRCIVERSGAYAFSVAEEIARQREARVPVLENLPAVLDTLPLPDKRAGRSEQNMFSIMHGTSDLCCQDRADHAAIRTEGTGDYLRGLSQEEMEVGHLASQGHDSDVLLSLQRKTEELDTNEKQVRQNRDEVSGHRVEGRQKPGMEGRCNVLSETRQLQADQVCAMSAGIPTYGPQRRLRDGASLVSSPSDQAMSASTGSGPSRRSRSGQQQIDELPSVCHEPRAQTVRASRFTRPDLARITPFHYDGVVWCVRVPSGAFVARRNGKVFITGNSGFPKSLDVSKAIDQAGGLSPQEQSTLLRDKRIAAGLSREEVAAAVGCTPSSVRDWEEGRARAVGRAIEYIIPSPEYRAKLAGALGYTSDERVIIGAGNGSRSLYETDHRGIAYGDPQSNAAKQWNGWGTALKPAHEPIVLARKPVIGTVAENVLQHGTGGLNIDGCRIEGRSWGSRPAIKLTSKGKSGGGFGQTSWEPIAGQVNEDCGLGRWPANVITSYPKDEYVLRSNVTTEQRKELFKWLYENA